MKNYRNKIMKIATAFAGFLLIGLLAACGDTSNVSNVDTSVPLPTVTPMTSATPVLGFVTATATPDVAKFAPPTQVVTAQPIVTATPVVFYTATVVNPQNDDNQGDANDNQGKGPDKGKPAPPSKPNPPGKDGGTKGKK